MEPLALILENSAQWFNRYNRILKAEGFRVLTVRSFEELLEKITAYCPHLVVVDDEEAGRSPTFKRSGLPHWSKCIGPIELSYTTLVISSASLRSPTTASHHIISKRTDLNSHVEVKLSEICKTIFSTASQSWKSASTEGLEGTLSIQAQIVGVSETGFYIESQMSASQPIQGFECHHQIFGGEEKSKAVLRLVNSEPGSKSAKSYFQIQNWTEKERQLLRRLVAERKMSSVG